MRAWYNVNTEKALEVILWLAGRGDAMDFYHILKVLFFADRSHLNEYGRPILGDTYIALPHGPVARTVYALLKKDDALEEQYLADRCGGDARSPFSVYDRYWVRVARPANLEAFSESEIEALQWSYDRYGAMSFNDLRDLTHADRAWRNARETDGIIKYEDMLDSGSNSTHAMEEQIARAAPQIVF